MVIEDVPGKARRGVDRRAARTSRSEHMERGIEYAQEGAGPGHPLARLVRIEHSAGATDPLYANTPHDTFDSDNRVRK